MIELTSLYNLLTCRKPIHYRHITVHKYNLEGLLQLHGCRARAVVVFRALVVVSGQLLLLVFLLKLADFLHNHVDGDFATASLLRFHGVLYAQQVLQDF